MKKFIEILKKLGLKVTKVNPNISHEKGYDQNDLKDLLYQLRKSKWAGVRKVKGRKNLFVSTNDLGPDGRLYPDYLERRKKRKKKKPEPFGWSEKNWR